MVDKRKNLKPKDGEEKYIKRQKLSAKESVDSQEENNEPSEIYAQQRGKKGVAKIEMAEIFSQDEGAGPSPEERCYETDIKKRKLSLHESDEEFEQKNASAKRSLLSSKKDDEQSSVTEHEQSGSFIDKQPKGKPEIDSKGSDHTIETKKQCSEKSDHSQAVENSLGKLSDTIHYEKDGEALKHLRLEDFSNLNAGCSEISKKVSCIADLANKSTKKLDASVGSSIKDELDSNQTSNSYSGSSSAGSVKLIQVEPTTTLTGNSSESDKSMEALASKAKCREEQGSEVPKDKAGNSGSNVVKETDRRKRTRKKHIVNTVQKQLEFYFNKANLAKDKFLMEQFDENSFVKLTTLAKFEKIKSITDDMKLIRHAVNNSSVLELSPDETKVKSLLGTALKEDELDCTIYVDHLSRNHSRDWVQHHFSKYGKVDYVGFPVFKDTKKSKGFAFVEFDSPVTAKKALLAYGAKTDDALGSCGEQRSGMRPFEVQLSNEPYHFDDYMMDMMPDSSSQDWDDGGHAPYDMDGEHEEYENVSEEDVESAPEEVPEPDSATLQETSAVMEPCSAETMHARDSSNNSSSSSSNNPDQNSSGIQNCSVAENVCEHGATSAKSEPLDADAQVAAQKKKKKKVHRRTRIKEKEKKRLLELKRKQKNDLDPVQLMVMSKREWKLKRDKYMIDQKRALAQCKVIMRRGKYHKDALSIEFDDNTRKLVDDNTKRSEKQKPFKVPGVIVKITLDRPLEEKKDMITGLKGTGGPGVAFVDAVVGESVVFVRFESADFAQTFVGESVWKNRCCLLDNEEEDKYWDKLQAAWTARITGPKEKKKIRGKQKVTARWRKFQEKMELRPIPKSQENFLSDSE